MSPDSLKERQVMQHKQMMTVVWCRGHAGAKHVRAAACTMCNGMQRLRTRYIIPFVINKAHGIHVRSIYIPVRTYYHIFMYDEVHIISYHTCMIPS